MSTEKGQAGTGNVNLAGAAEYQRSERLRLGIDAGNWALIAPPEEMVQISTPAPVPFMVDQEWPWEKRGDGCQGETSIYDPLMYGSATPQRLDHWEKPVKKTVYTLNIGSYEPAVCALTYPLLRHFAKKIGAEFEVISERRFPEWPIVYEKLQIHERAKAAGNDWSIYVDSDALINPEMFDPTEHLRKDTVMMNGRDMAGIRWQMDSYFRRDGRMIGACNWFALASDWCLDMWRPIEDLTPAEAFARIHPTNHEIESGQFRDNHLIDDYTLSRNIAKFGLKFRTLTDLCGDLGWKDQMGRGASPFLFHLYAIPTEVKIQKLLDVLSGPREKGGWQMMKPDDVAEFKAKWGIK